MDIINYKSLWPYWPAPSPPFSRRKVDTVINWNKQRLCGGRWRREPHYCYLTEVWPKLAAVGRILPAPLHQTVNRKYSPLGAPHQLIFFSLKNHHFTSSKPHFKNVHFNSLLKSSINRPEGRKWHQIYLDYAELCMDIIIWNFKDWHPFTGNI